MKLAVSNIAWLPSERDAAYAILNSYGVTGLEIAPSLYFEGSAEPFAPSEASIAAAGVAVRENGLSLVSMQSVMYGTEGARLFGSAPARRDFEARMRNAIALAQRLAIPNIVLGAPAQRRIPPGVPEREASAIALDLFGRLAQCAEAASCRIALETIPAGEGSSFLTRTSETLAFDRPEFRCGSACNDW